MTGIATTLTAIYDAAISDQNWRRALDACAASMESAGAMIYEFPSVEEVVYSLEEINSHVAGHGDVLLEYNRMVSQGRGSGYDIEGLGYIQKSPALSVSYDDEIWRLNAEYRARPEIALSAQAGYFRRVFVNLSHDPNTPVGLIFLYGDCGNDALPGHLRSTGAALAPHVSKALELHRFTNELRRKYSAVLSVLDRVDTGVVVVSETGQVVVANRAARHLFDAQDAISQARNGILLCKDETAQSELLTYVKRIALTAAGENDSAGHIMQIARENGASEVVAIISPLRDAQMEIERGMTGALITLVDPSRPMTIESDLISRAYKLSAAETKVAGLVLRGLSNQEISDEIGVSAETIKTQLRSIFLKSGCKNRISFLWRVFQLIPPII